MIASVWTQALWLFAAAWTIFSVLWLLYQIGKEARRIRAEERMTELLNGELKSAIAAGDEMAARRVERALGERQSRKNHPTSWGQP